MRLYLSTFAVVWVWLLCFAMSGEAASLCKNPKKGYPALAFSMVANNSGSARKNCDQKLNRARYLGFTDFTYNPVFYYNAASGDVTSSLDQKDIQYCLNKAQRMGFDINYKPLLEALQPAGVEPEYRGPDQILGDHLLRSALAHEKMQWRARFDYDPAKNFQKVVIDPFLKFLKTSKRRMLRDKTKVSIVTATELYTSVERHPEQWNRVIWNTQKKLESLGLRKQATVGIDPSIFSIPFGAVRGDLKTFDRSECEAFKKMLWTSDFFAFSVYGNYVEKGYFRDASKAVDKLFDEEVAEFIHATAGRGCVLDQGLVTRLSNADYFGRDKGRSAKTSWMGEIGFSGSLRASFSQFRDGKAPEFQSREQYLQYRDHTFKADHAKFRERAPQWVNAVLDSARGPNGKGSFVEKINFWITGGFDIFGFSDLPSLGAFDSKEGQYTKVDPIHGPDQIVEVAKIRDELQRYAKERCEGWRPRPPHSHSKKRGEVRPAAQCSPQETRAPIELSDFNDALKSFDLPELDFSDIDPEEK